MGWDYNLMPVEYLEKRLRYYKRRKNKWTRAMEGKDKVLSGRYSKDQFAQAIAVTDDYIKAFEDALIKLI